MAMGHQYDHLSPDEIDDVEDFIDALCNQIKKRAMARWGSLSRPGK